MSDWPELRRSVVDTIAEKECWWTISGPNLLELLRRAHAGENPDSRRAAVSLVGLRGLLG